MVSIYNLPDPIIHCNFKDVYAPSDDTYLIIDYFKEKIFFDYFDGLKISKIEKILDMGTGTGIIAIFLQLIKIQNSNFKAKIYASDILKEAIKCAKLNEKANNINREIEFIESNLFNSFPNSLKNSFDIIIFNPPYLSSLKLINKSKKSNMDVSWDGGRKGYEILLLFLDNVVNFLNLNHECYIYFVNSSSTNLNEFNKLIEKKGFLNEILTKKHFFFEDIILNRMSFNKL